MTEKYVRVPVSLIERIRAGLPLWKYEFDPEADALMTALDALLLQQLPTAEPSSAKRWQAIAREIIDGDYEALRDRLGDLPGCPAEPLRIEDLAPGTTFTAALSRGNNGAGPRRWVIILKGWSAASSHHHQVRLTDLDPSTIRDVTPPRDAA